MKELLTLIYVSNLFDRLDDSGTRTELRKMDKTPVLEHLNDDPEKTQLLLRYVYLGNRIGNGILEGVLDKKIIFDTWKPHWWRDLWKKLEPLVKQERERRNDQGLYDKFEKFVDKECQEK